MSIDRGWRPLSAPRATDPYAEDIFVPADDVAWPPTPTPTAVVPAAQPVRRDAPALVGAAAGPLPSGLILPAGVRPPVRPAATPAVPVLGRGPQRPIDHDPVTQPIPVVPPGPTVWAPRPQPGYAPPGPSAPMLATRPETGWRRTVCTLTGGRWNPGPSPAATAVVDRHRRIRTPVRGCRRVAVLSVKGGVGKTTVAAMLGLTYAELRGDRVLAIDANPDLGTLADRLTGDVEVGMQHLLDFLSDRPRFSIGDIERFVSASSRLQVLAGSREPCGAAAFTRAEYVEAIGALSTCYQVMIIDTGTGLSHAALAGVLATADSVVIVGEPTVDAASRASMTLDWLAGIGFAGLAAHATVVMSLDRGSREVDQHAIIEHFRHRCAAVVEVPADSHLAAGARIDRARCHSATRAAFEELAAAVAERFPAPAPRRFVPEGP